MFTHLRVHSHYSLLSALPKIDQIIKRAKDAGMTAVALTDYSNMYGTIEFYSKCKKEGLKSIIGVEFSMYYNERRFKLVILAKNLQGYKNLMRLTSIVNMENPVDPTLTMEILEQYKDGLIVLSGGPWGDISTLLTVSEDEAALRLQKYKALFREYGTYLFLLFLLAIAVLTCGPGLRGSFLWDDEEQIVKNEVVHHISNAATFLTGSTFHSGGSGELSGIYYRPVMPFFFSLLYSFFGANPTVFHSFQLIVHVANAFLIFLLLRAIFSRDKSSISSKSEMLKAPMPIRARVSRCTPPTPPMSAMAMRLCRSACCSCSVTQPMLRSNATS